MKNAPLSLCDMVRTVLRTTAEAAIQRLRFSCPKTMAFSPAETGIYNADLQSTRLMPEGNHGNGGCDGLTPFFLCKNADEPIDHQFLVYHSEPGKSMQQVLSFFRRYAYRRATRS